MEDDENYVPFSDDIDQYMTENYFKESYKASSESAMRLAIHETKAQRRKKRKIRIVSRRGAFRWLPVHFSNDLVHGSWWFVLGSLIATIIPVIPLIDLFHPFWPTPESSLPLFQDAGTFILLIISGLFYTLGSWAFVRATEEPALRPLFENWDHFCTDELLAAWLFLFGTLPFPAFIGIYVYYNADMLVYWGCFLGSLLFVIATYFFVLACYPSDEPREQITPYITQFICSKDCWMQRHLSNDWLAATWIFFYATLLLFFGSLFMLYESVISGENALEIFDWASS